MRMPGVFRRQQDAAEGRHFQRELRHDRLSRLEFSCDKAIRSAHRGGVTWMDLDPVEHRYLLAGAADASLAVYDTQQPGGASCTEDAPLSRHSHAHAADHRALFTITKQTPGGHSFSISSVAWYPVDSGLFVSGGFDHAVKVWDANALQVATTFSLTSRVFAVAMSPAAATHCLVAAGSADPHVMLCDIVSGGFTHTLTGHRAGVWAVAWSPSCEWELVSGSADGQLRLWDIRRPGTLHVFDMHDTAGQPAAASDEQAPAPGLAAGRAGHSPGRSHTAAWERASLYGLAHSRSISGVVPTPDGLFWLSAGADDRLRLWDAASRAHMLVHYPSTFNRASKARQLSVTEDGAAVFHPTGGAVQVFDVQRGKQLSLLAGGHFESINCCKWNPAAEELYTGSNDHQIVVWAPRSGGGGQQGEEAGGGSDKDNWSD